MEAIDALLSRYSSLKLAELAPMGVALDKIIESATRAPDHGNLRPWRFILIEGEARNRFGDLLADQIRLKGSVTDEMLQRERAKALRAPMIIVVAAMSNPAARIPLIEQVMSAAAPAQNIMLAAFALGFGAIWKTGDAAYSDNVKAAFGLKPSDGIVGFVYIGTDVSGPARAPRPIWRDFVQHWSGPVTQ